MRNKKIALMLSVVLALSGMAGTMTTVSAAELVTLSEEVDVAEDIPAEEGTEDTSLEVTEDGSEEEQESPENQETADIQVKDEEPEEQQDMEVSETEADNVFSSGEDSIAVQDAATNDTFETAVNISTNQTYSSSLQSPAYERWYKFKLPKDGNISVTFSHDYISNSSSVWDIQVFNSKKEELKQASFKGNELSTTTAKLGLASDNNATYYLKIYHGSVYTTAGFNFKVNYSATSNWEKELNNDYKSANAIKTNTAVHGSIQKYRDEDWYKFSLPTDGNISLSCAHDYIDSKSDFLNATVYNGDMKEISRFSFISNELKSTTDKIGLPAGNYYLKVYYGTYSIDREYVITANYTAADNWETELNDQQKTADTIIVNKTYYGSLQWKSEKADEDWYKVKLAKSGNVQFIFNHDYEKSCGWDMTVYNGNMKELDSWHISGYGENIKEGKKLSAGTYYIKFEKGYSDSLSTSSYSFKLACAVPKIKMNKTSVTIGKAVYTGKAIKPTVTVKYGSTLLKAGQDYKVSYSKAVKAGSSVKVTITGLKKYTGTITRTVKIKAKSVKKLTVKGIPSKVKYTGKQIRPKSVRVYDGKRRLKYKTDYTVIYGKNIKKGKGTVTIKGMGNYSGKLKKTFEIVSKK